MGTRSEGRTVSKRVDNSAPRHRPVADASGTDRHVGRRPRPWWIQTPAAETKTKDPIEAPWPEKLARHLEIYLTDHRAGIVALRGVRPEALWLSIYGLPVSSNAIYICVVARTRAANPHLFRDSATTSIAIDDPKHLGIATRLLGHRNQSTTERYCNQARTIEASRRMQRALLVSRNGSVNGADDLDRIRQCSGSKEGSVGAPLRPVWCRKGPSSMADRVSALSDPTRPLCLIEFTPRPRRCPWHQERICIEIAEVASPAPITRATHQINYECSSINYQYCPKLDVSGVSAASSGETSPRTGSFNLMA